MQYRFVGVWRLNMVSRRFPRIPTTAHDLLKATAVAKRAQAWRTDYDSTEKMHLVEISRFASVGTLPSMLPVFVNEFDAVTVRIQNIRSIIARAVVESDAGCTIVSGSCSNRRVVGRLDLFLTVCHKTNMRGIAICTTFT